MGLRSRGSFRITRQCHRPLPLHLARLPHVPVLMDYYGKVPMRVTPRGEGADMMTRRFMMISDSRRRALSTHTTALCEPVRCVTLSADGSDGASMFGTCADAKMFSEEERSARIAYKDKQRSGAAETLNRFEGTGTAPTRTTSVIQDAISLYEPPDVYWVLVSSSATNTSRSLSKTFLRRYTDEVFVRAHRESRRHMHPKDEAVSSLSTPWREVPSPDRVAQALLDSREGAVERVEDEHGGGEIRRDASGEAALMGFISSVARRMLLMGEGSSGGCASSVHQEDDVSLTVGSGAAVHDDVGGRWSIRKSADRGDMCDEKEIGSERKQPAKKRKKKTFSISSAFSVKKKKSSSGLSLNEQNEVLCACLRLGVRLAIPTPSDNNTAYKEAVWRCLQFASNENRREGGSASAGFMKLIEGLNSAWRQQFKSISFTSSSSSMLLGERMLWTSFLDAPQLLFAQIEVTKLLSREVNKREAAARRAGRGQGSAHSSSHSYSSAVSSSLTELVPSDLVELLCFTVRSMCAVAEQVRRESASHHNNHNHNSNSNRDGRGHGKDDEVSEHKEEESITCMKTHLPDSHTQEMMVSPNSGVRDSGRLVEDVNGIDTDYFFILCTDALAHALRLLELRFENVETVVEIPASLPVNISTHDGTATTGTMRWSGSSGVLAYRQMLSANDIVSLTVCALSIRGRLLLRSSSSSSSSSNSTCAPVPQRSQSKEGNPVKGERGAAAYGGQELDGFITCTTTSAVSLFEVNARHTWGAMKRMAHPSSWGYSKSAATNAIVDRNAVARLIPRLERLLLMRGTDTSLPPSLWSSSSSSSVVGDGSKGADTCTGTGSMPVEMGVGGEGERGVGGGGFLAKAQSLLRGLIGGAGFGTGTDSSGLGPVMDDEILLEGSRLTLRRFMYKCAPRHDQRVLQHSDASKKRPPPRRLLLLYPQALAQLCIVPALVENNCSLWGTAAFPALNVLQPWPTVHTNFSSSPLPQRGSLSYSQRSFVISSMISLGLAEGFLSMSADGHNEDGNSYAFPTRTGGAAGNTAAVNNDENVVVIGAVECLFSDACSRAAASVTSSAACPPENDKTLCKDHTYSWETQVLEKETCISSLSILFSAAAFINEQSRKHHSLSSMGGGATRKFSIHGGYNGICCAEQLVNAVITTPSCVRSLVSLSKTRPPPANIQEETERNEEEKERQSESRRNEGGEGGADGNNMRFLAQSQLVRLYTSTLHEVIAGGAVMPMRRAATAVQHGALLTVSSLLSQSLSVPLARKGTLKMQRSNENEMIGGEIWHRHEETVAAAALLLLVREAEAKCEEERKRKTPSSVPVLPPIPKERPTQLSSRDLLQPCNTCNQDNLATLCIVELLFIGTRLEEALRTATLSLLERPPQGSHTDHSFDQLAVVLRHVARELLLCTYHAAKLSFAEEEEKVFCSTEKRDGAFEQRQQQQGKDEPSTKVISNETINSFVESSLQITSTVFELSKKKGRFDINSGIKTQSLDHVEKHMEDACTALSDDECWQLLRGMYRHRFSASDPNQSRIQLLTFTRAERQSFVAWLVGKSKVRF